MEKNCMWTYGLLLPTLIFLVGCHDSDSPSGALQLSKETISIAVGQGIVLTRTSEDGVVEVMLPKGKDFILTVDNDQVAQVKGKTIKGITPGKATVAVAAGAEYALLTIEVQVVDKDQKIALSPARASTPVDRTIIFGVQEGVGVNVVVTTVPATGFTISTPDPDKVKVERHKVTGLAVRTYRLVILAGGTKINFELIVGDKELTRIFFKSSGRKVFFVPEYFEDTWDRQELLKKMIENNASYPFDHIDEEHKAIQFTDKNVKTSHMSTSYSHIVYVLSPKGSKGLYLGAMYLDQPNGMFEFIYVGYILGLGFNINQNNPPKLQVDQESNHYFEDVHPTLPCMVRIYYKTRINNEGDKVEDVYARLTLVVCIQ